jgi:hypothetical protein
MAQRGPTGIGVDPWPYVDSPLALHKNCFMREGFSRKDAKRCRVFKGFPLRLCAFAPLRLCAFAPLREKCFLSHVKILTLGTFCAKLFSIRYFPFAICHLVQNEIRKCQMIDGK